MSISLMTYAFRIPLGENHCTKMVLLKLADHASDDGVCWPSWSHLVKHTGYSRRSVAYALKQLEDMGIIRREQRMGTSTMYHIDVNAMKRHTPYPLRGHNSKGYEPEDEPNFEDSDDCTSATVAPSSAMVAPTSAKVARGECNDCTQIIKEPPVGTINETKERLLTIYLVWCACSGGAMDKKQFANAIKPLLQRYSDKELTLGVKKYFELLEDKRFMSVKRFAETAAAYIKAKTTRGIDPNSDMPPEEQAKYE